jgi:hypothetical protein
VPSTVLFFKVSYDGVIFAFLTPLLLCMLSKRTQLTIRMLSRFCLATRLPVQRPETLLYIGKRHVSGLLAETTSPVFFFCLVRCTDPLQDNKLRAVIPWAYVWHFSFRSIRTEDVIVARPRMGYTAKHWGIRCVESRWPFVHTMVHHLVFHTFYSNAGIVPKKVVRVICTVRGTISYPIIAGTFLNLCK